MTWLPAASIDAIPPQEGRKVLYGDQEIALFNLGECFMAVENRCPHKAGPLSDGIVSGETVYCPLHNLNISLKTGCALKGGEGQVRVYPTKVQGNTVYIHLESNSS